jgi:hybrid cluster-associated redox disulfide protein
MRGTINSLPLASNANVHGAAYTAAWMAACSLSQSKEYPGRQVHDVCSQARASGMKRKFSDDATMDEIMRRSPAAIRVVLQHGMLCVGCPIASFHTVSDAAHEHDLNEEDLRCDLQAAIDSPDRD